MTTLIFVVGTILITVWYMAAHIRKERRAAVLLKENAQAGVNEPPSLHPVIDLEACIGCGGCVDACPEQPLHSPLGLVRGKAVLIDAAHCIGHGACKIACPTNAIELVFGTEKRGVDIPIVKPNFETNSPHIFIAGELGGMGLIANAIDQGRSAIENIKKVSGIGQGDRLDVLIVGAGPSGFAASLASMQHKLRYRTVEQGDLGGTVYNFPRGKIVMTRAVNLPMVGKVKITETTKEKLLEFWQKVQKETGVKIHFHERLENITRTKDGFVVKTTAGEYQTLTVLLCLGRGGTPRKLGVPGDEHPKVVYRLIDPAQFAGKHVLVVGGGDSALEAAYALADEKGASVTLSYREKAFTRAKEKNRKKVEQAASEGRLTVLYSSNVKEVRPDEVDLEQNGTLVTVANEAIICCLGGILPTPFLKQIGIEVETKRGETSKDLKARAAAGGHAPRPERAEKPERAAQVEAKAEPEAAQSGASCATRAPRAEAAPEAAQPAPALPLDETAVAPEKADAMVAEEVAQALAQFGPKAAPPKEPAPAEDVPEAEPRPAMLRVEPRAGAPPRLAPAPRPAAAPAKPAAAPAKPAAPAPPKAAPRPAAQAPPTAPDNSGAAPDANDLAKLDQLAADLADLARKLSSG